MPCHNGDCVLHSHTCHRNTQYWFCVGWHRQHGHTCQWVSRLFHVNYQCVKCADESHANSWECQCTNAGGVAQYEFANSPFDVPNARAPTSAWARSWSASSRSLSRTLHLVKRCDVESSQLDWGKRLLCCRFKHHFKIQSEITSFYLQKNKGTWRTARKATTKRMFGMWVRHSLVARQELVNFERE